MPSIFHDTDPARDEKGSHLHSLKLTARTRKWAGPQKDMSSSNHPFSGATFVSGRVVIA